MTSDPMLSAKRGNERTEWALDYYKQELTKRLKDAMQDGYIVGTTPPRGAAEELQGLLEQEPSLLQTAMDMNQHPATRGRAGDALWRLQQLKMQFGGV